jgi:Zn finger protein HypA/HybF involved in hydrogenase expression
MRRRCVQVVAAKLREISGDLEKATPGIDSPSILSQLTEAIVAMDFTEKPVEEKCSVCGGPREEAAWSGICANCQDKGHRPEKRICEPGQHEAGMKDGKWWCHKCDSPIKLH